MPAHPDLKHLLLDIIYAMHKESLETHRMCERKIESFNGRWVKLRVRDDGNGKPVLQYLDDEGAMSVEGGIRVPGNN
jgi:hypothetical protein